MQHHRCSRHSKTAVACAVLLSAPTLSRAQATLPPSAPTSVSQLPSAQPATVATPSSVVVRWNGIDLQIDARNASLNAVLHAVALKTHLKIQGSAPDERIFGTYGPGPLNQVVPALLNGVAVNVLLTERQGGAADELVLSSRSGGQTPAYIPTQQDADASAPPSQPGPGAGGYVPRSRPGAFHAVNAGQLPAGADPVLPDDGVNGRDNGINGGNSNGVNGPDNGVNGRDDGMNGTDNGLNNSNSAVNPSSSTTEGGTAPAVRTPQDIFEQLQRLRQQQVQTTPQ